MSGDVQPRKRKDKKKRKEDGDLIPEKPHVPVFTNNTVVNEDQKIHVHKDEGTGGGICAKLVFFILFSALAVLIGLIITEHRGLTDVDTADSNSKFSQLFEGWVDTNSHDDHDDHGIESLEDDDHDEDHDEHDEEDEEEHDDDDDEHDEHDEEVEESEEEDHEEHLEDEDEQEDDDGDQEDEVDDNDDDEQSIEEDEEENEDVASKEDEYTLDEDDDQDHDEDDDQAETEEADDGDTEEVDQKDQEDEGDEDEEDDIKASREKRDISEEKLSNEADDDDEGADNDDDDNKSDEGQDLDDKDGDEEEQEDDDQASNENDDTADTDDAKETEQDEDDGTDDNVKAADTTKEVKKPKKAEQKQEPEAEGEEKDNEGTVDSSGMAVKIGVGVALLVVAHLVLIKKWRNDFSDEDDDKDDGEETVEPNTAKAKYQELATAYIRPVSNEHESTNREIEYEDDEDEQEEEEVSEEEEGDERDEGQEYEDDDVEEDEVDDEDEELLKRLEARYGKLQENIDKKFPEKPESDSDRDSEDNDYEYTNITNEQDSKIKKDIDEAHSSIKNNTSHALALFDKILQKSPSSPRALYGKALTLDLLADQRRSNDILEKALQLYITLLKTDSVPAALFLEASERCINRMRFLGQYRTALQIHKLVIDKFPNAPQHLNSLAVTYLTINRIEEARSVLKEVLAKWPNNGFALVHYGFILKTTDNALEKAVRYLKKGINTKDEGVIDGRFYFHLGDALVRLGRREEADKVYEEGTNNKVFFSKYQRSLYNVPKLSGKPWWNPEDIPYPKFFNLLLQSWRKIREEGLSILSEKGYFQDESENLRDTGEWKQFELYARGQKNVNNCKKCPFTCSIINQIPEAKNCKRGQTKFSVMHPGTHIWPHCGPTNCRLRAHLGLKVPSNTFLRVADDIRSWKEGEIIVFDDSFEHEVWHNGTDFRLILIVDIWHPELTPSEKNTLSPI
uniref:Aspartyl/asparaginyl beta-hydroxylase isoform X3 n=1 Tax=Diabrotica virgifera virgifera TaxID=50390 RepID=A0A6P7FX98_DIAVI